VLKERNEIKRKKEMKKKGINSELGKRIESALESGKKIIKLAESFAGELENIKAQLKKEDTDSESGS
jgi:hypothetical protein